MIDARLLCVCLVDYVIVRIGVANLDTDSMQSGSDGSASVEETWNPGVAATPNFESLFGRWLPTSRPEVHRHCDWLRCCLPPQHANYLKIIITTMVFTIDASSCTGNLFIDQTKKDA